MRKIHLLFGLALVAACVFSAFGAVSAFALTWELAEWLLDGVAVTALTSVITTGEALFENLLNGGIILCSGIFEGSVGPNGEDEVTKILNLGGVEIPELDEANATGGIKCGGVKTCENETEIWPLNLPYLTEAMLDLEENLFWDLALVNGNNLLPAYWILCLVLGTSVNELCQAVADAEGNLMQDMSNGATSVTLAGSVVPEGSCNGNALDGNIINDAEHEALIEDLEAGHTLQING